MAPRHGYDPELLLQFLMAHPEWSAYRVALELTEDNKRSNDPWRKTNVVTTSTIYAARRQNRAKWAARGFTLPEMPRRTKLVRDLLANTGTRKLARDEHQGNVSIRRLRQLQRYRDGLAVEQIELQKAMRWEADRRANREVVDVGPDGLVFIRPAMPHELDGLGNLIDLIAMPKPDSGPGSDIDIEPDLDDALEVAIWEQRDMDEPARLRTIAALRLGRAETDPEDCDTRTEQPQRRSRRHRR